MVLFSRLAYLMIIQKEKIMRRPVSILSFG